MREGGCQCGRVRYQCASEPSALYVCHCTNCRAQSASAFGISFIVPAASVRVIAGEPASHEWQTDSGRRSRGAFCPSCGSRLWHEDADRGASRATGTVSIKGGSLDEPVDLSAAVHIWTASKLAGVVIPDRARQFAREPDE